MSTLAKELPKYPLPAFLEGRCSPQVFYKWLSIKGETLLLRDQKRKKPFSLNATKSQYKQEIYRAVLKSGERDPYTGDALAWELIGTWDTSEPHPEDYKKRFALMPTIDHINPDAHEFEICSWLVNECKSYLNPEEFYQLCRKVVANREQ